MNSSKHQSSAVTALARFSKSFTRQICLNDGQHLSSVVYALDQDCIFTRYPVEIAFTGRFHLATRLQVHVTLAPSDDPEGKLSEYLFISLINFFTSIITAFFTSIITATTNAIS